MPTDSEKNTFIVTVRRLINENKIEILERREKYIRTLALLGLVKDDVIFDIYSLTPTERWIVQQDDNPSFPGEVWICKKNLHGECIYIKLKVKESDGEVLLLMSYHIDWM